MTRFLVAIPVVVAVMVGFAAMDRSKEILDLEEQRSGAIAAHNAVFLNNLYDDGFRGVAGDGSEIDKANLLKVFSRDDGSIKFHRERIAVDVLGDIALSTGELVGESRSGDVVRSRYCHVYVRNGGHWKLRYGQATPVRMQSK